MLAQTSAGFYNALKLWPETWAVTTVYTLGDAVKPTTYAGSYPTTPYSYICTARTSDYKSGGSEPTWPTTASETVVDSHVTWTCYTTNKTYQVKAPQGSTVPYVTFGLLTDVPMGTFASPMKMESLTFWVNVFSDKSTADVSEIADEVMTAMDNITLTVTGYTNMKCVREFIGSIIWDLETGIYQVPLRYRLWLDKA